MNAFKPEASALPGSKEPHKEAKRNERRFPRISFEERRLIERSGGDYRGFVTTDRGPMFEEVWAHRRARYSTEHQGITEVFIETCGTDALDTPQVTTPNDIKGFELMLVEFSPSGHELAGPYYFKLHRENFPGQALNLDEFRTLAREFHDMLVARTGEAGVADLRREAEDFLEKRGWRRE